MCAETPPKQAYAPLPWRLAHPRAYCTLRGVHLTMTRLLGSGGRGVRSDWLLGTADIPSSSVITFSTRLSCPNETARLCMWGCTVGGCSPDRISLDAESYLYRTPRLRIDRRKRHRVAAHRLAIYRRGNGRHGWIECQSVNRRTRTCILSINPRLTPD